jgi:hypothetical protein
MARAYAPYHPGKFAILGVIHRDREAEPLLARWLDTWRPTVITVEFSRYGLHFRESRGEALKSRVLVAADGMRSRGMAVDQGALDALLAYLAPSFEFIVASSYAARHGYPLYLVDDDRFSRSRLADMEELVSRENLERLLCGPAHDDFRRQKAVARLFFEKGIRTFSYTEEMEVRDRGMRRRIDALVVRHEGAAILHICGWQHLCDPQGIFNSLNPTKVFIYDKALCV